MFYQIKRILFKVGTSSKFLERFNREGLVEKQPGFIHLEVLLKKVGRSNVEGPIVTQWESEENWKYWEKSSEDITRQKIIHE